MIVAHSIIFHAYVIGFIFTLGMTLGERRTFMDWLKELPGNLVVSTLWPLAVLFDITMMII
jgi:hypothetical protein